MPRLILPCDIPPQKLCQVDKCQFGLNSSQTTGDLSSVVRAASTGEREGKFGKETPSLWFMENFQRFSCHCDGSGRSLALKTSCDHNITQCCECRIGGGSPYWLSGQTGEPF
ncbi:Uncharacterised protein at_DN0858 [Pycnogonum litorale]